MQKIVIEKSVAEEIKKKLESYKQVSVKLQSNKNIGVTPDGQVYDLDNPTEKFYYDLKMKFVETENVEKGFGKYLSKKFVKGKWVYKYHQDRNIARSKINFCTSKPLSCTLKNALAMGEQFIKDWQQDWNNNRNKSRCPVFGGKTVVVVAIDENGKEGISLQHFGYKGSGKKLKRPDKVIKERAEILPFAKEMLESKDKCIVNEVRTNNNLTEYEILGKAKINGKVEKICVIVSKRKYEPITYLSIIKKAISEDTAFITDVFLLKSSKNVPFWAEQEGGGTLPQPIKTISQQNNLSSRKVNKSLTFSGHKLQGRTKLYGMDISIENKKGTYRKGVDSDGHKWKILMHYDYGYIRGTVGTDSDHVDCYIGPDKNAKKVYVIHQNNPITHKYDEDKCMLCFESADAAKKAYMKQYDRPGFFGGMETLNIEQFKTFVFSKQGSKIHKSFIVEITDITENNKHKKVEQVEKALNAIYNNKPFIIKHISNKNDDSKKYENISLRIENFDKSKIEKAVRNISFSLDIPLKYAKGEAFTFKSQENLTEKWVKDLTEKTKKVYEYVISYFDLPEKRIVCKAIGDLYHNGKIVYNPETGIPIKKSDWDKFVKNLQKFIDSLYWEEGEKIILDATTLGKILNRLVAGEGLNKIKTKTLEEIKYKGKTFDWISRDVKRLKNVFGEKLNRVQLAKIEVAQQSAAIEVTKVTETMRNDIKKIIIDGIKNKQSKSKVSQNLFDRCASLNRDMQRIADTEIQNTTNSAYVQEEVYNAKENEKIYFQRFEIIDDNTCKKCKAIKGKIALWSKEPLESENIKDEIAEIAIWEGKTDGYVIGTMHPYCRGSWIRYFPN